MTGLFPILWHYIQAKRYRRRWSNRVELEEWQNRQVEKHLKRILPLSAYYRQLYSGLPISEWRRFPIITKTEMMEHFNGLNTVGLDRDQAFKFAIDAEASRDFVPMIGNITVGLSSGTSGNRGLFVVSPSEKYAWAGNLLAKILPGSLWDRHRAALFLRANSNLYRSVDTRRFSFAFYDLLESLPTLIARLDEFKPTILVAPPSALRRIANAQRSKKLSVHPTRIFSVAEVLEPQDKALIEESFQTPVHQIYQATEGFLGISCSHGTLHLNEDIVVVQKEWLDDKQRKFVPIITDFRRCTQPILRYRLNDILTERTGPCPCGSPFVAIESVEGRCDDIFVFPGQKPGTTVEIFPDFIRRVIITSREAIKEYRVIQHSNGQVEVQLEVDPSEITAAEVSLRKNFQELCNTIGCTLPEITLKPFVDSPADSKMRRIIRRMNPKMGPSGIALC